MFKLEEPKYCSKCILQEGLGFSLSDEGICPVCIGGPPDEDTINRLNLLVQRYADFKNYAEQNKGSKSYDCILMLSGGKDSIYMLYKLVEVHKFKPLAFTFINPFESRNALHNIEKTLHKLNVEHIAFTPNIAGYKALMKHIFTMSAEEIASRLELAFPEKLPCSACTAYMYTVAILFAVQMEIPYILYCASDVQMSSVSFDRTWNIGFFEKFCNDRLTHMLFGSRLDKLKNMDDDDLPKIVYPYISETYNARKITDEVKRLGLYETSPTETHCSLYGMLQYFSIKNYNRYFYVLEAAPAVRAGSMKRESVIYGLEQFKKSFMQVLAEENISPEVEENARMVLKYICATDSQLDYVWNNIRNVHQVARELDIKLS